MATLGANPNPGRITHAMWWAAQRWCERSADLALGGVYANKSGYHNTRAANQASWPNDYSIRRARDMRGPSDKAAAIDVTYRSAQAGNYSAIAADSQRLYRAGQASDPRMKGWVEFFGNTDSDTEVEGWNYQDARPSSSDSTHLWHIHGSECREMVDDAHNKGALLSVLTGESLAAYTARMVASWPGFGGVTLRADTWGASVYLAQVAMGVDADGEFGAKTAAAVMAWQRKHSVPVDGEIGPQTWATLGRKAGDEVDMATLDELRTLLREEVKRVVFDAPLIHPQIPNQQAFRDVWERAAGAGSNRFGEAPWATTAQVDALEARVAAIDSTLDKAAGAIAEAVARTATVGDSAQPQ